jgi:hypothetical protein
METPDYGYCPPGDPHSDYTRAGLFPELDHGATFLGLSHFLVRRPMSALGHKRTYAVQKGTSALPPIAQTVMSALGQKRTRARESSDQSATLTDLKEWYQSATES